MTVDQLRSRYGARSDYHLSQILGVTRQAVSEWRANGRVPKQREKEATQKGGSE